MKSVYLAMMALCLTACASQSLPSVNQNGIRRFDKNCQRQTPHPNKNDAQAMSEYFEHTKYCKSLGYNTSY